jgi:hypothetical protein
MACCWPSAPRSRSIRALWLAWPTFYGWHRATIIRAGCIYPEWGQGMHRGASAWTDRQSGSPECSSSRLKQPRMRAHQGTPGPERNRPPSSRVMGIVTALLLSSCGGVGVRETYDAGPSESEQVASLSAGPVTPPVPFVTNAEVLGLVVPPGRASNASFEEPAVGTLMGWNSPIALPSPDGRYIAYNSWRQLVAYDPQRTASSQGILPGDTFGIPSIRVLDTETGEDSLLADGAFSLAWGANGAIAYFQGLAPEYRWMASYPGQVLVKESLEGAPQLWIEDPGEYIVHSWARDELLVYGQDGVLNAVSEDVPIAVELRAVHPTAPTRPSAFLLSPPGDARVLA